MNKILESKPEYIRDNMAKPDSELMEELDETQYYVWLCKEVARNDNLSKRGRGPEEQINSLTHAMKRFLAKKGKQKMKKGQDISWDKITDLINEKFAQEEVTPLHRAFVSEQCRRGLRDSV